ncbi:universal stress protein [Halobium salinum]|uniref:Universal stress protein n=1 Tax=Halobium salinum TaxID=1364940 RepID=A0ABD5PE27_9EURY|nr:universal stress protein [Halobium salinum]
MAPRILVPVDGSPKSTAGLEHALSTYPDAEVTVLHVLSSPEGWDDTDPPLPPELAEEWVDGARTRADDLLAAARELASDHGVTPEVAVETGDVWREIVDYACDHDVDHVVLGSHGRTDEAGVALGSVASTVARRAPVSVTIIR